MEIKFSYQTRTTKISLHADRPTLALALKECVCRDGGIVFLDRGLGQIWRQKIIGFGIPTKQIFPLKDGEKSKEWQVIGSSLEVLSKRAHERNTPVLVIGGGAACDAGALVASLYRRGVPLVLVPTTLLAMVDAAIGGKTAIDLQRNDEVFKNIAGTFYPAREVHFWPGWLDTLPTKERLSGVGELIKMLWLSGDDIDLQPIRAWIDGKVKTEAIWPLVEKAIVHKAKVVAADPLDTKGVRSILNYGHTLGHAFESLGKGKMAHGEAVAWGMWAESSFLENSNEFSTSLRQRIGDLGFTIPKFMRGILPGQIISFLRADKKMSNGKIEMSVLSGFGKVEKISLHPHELAKFAADITNNL